MNNTEQRKRTRDFVSRWTGRGYEKGESQKFWIELLEVLGVDCPFSFISFEDQVHLDHTSFIDGFIPATHVLIEQKSIDKSLRNPIRQSDGSMLTPFQQAKRYSAELPYDDRPRWIVTCNFKEFLVYDMNQPNGEPSSILLEDLERELYRLKFLVMTHDATLQREMEVSLAAGELVGRLYDALLKQYIDPTSEHSLKSLNALCVRLVFCLYAEDAGLFPHRNAFHDYLASFHPENVRDALIKLFKMLDTPTKERDPYERPELLAFPYVNGGLFRDENIEIPRFTPEILHILLNDCSADFDWSGISPTIFGAVFESTLNPETRRSGGMHYTSIENIHKVIDPLFLTSLAETLENIEKIENHRKRRAALVAYIDRLASLTFLDPACGSGNFLTETFLSLRRLENRALKLIYSESERMLGGDFSPIKVSISQFYGIEINDFAATVAKTALWIAESQMMKETEDIVGRDIDFLPLKSYTNITEGNALQIDWTSVVAKDKLSFIMGNPPFVGARMMAQGSEQKKDVENIFGKIKDVQDLDYVCCWYKLAAQYMQGTDVEAGFVSTNSICQGSQVPILWNVLFHDFGIHINFAYQTFKWGSESSDQAAVHCVIVGFATRNRERKLLFNASGERKTVGNISPYLSEGGDIFVTASKENLSGMPKMCFGNQPRDGGHFILTEEERNQLISREPALERWIHPYMGADEFIKGKRRYCLWLVHALPSDIKASRTLYERVEAVREFRLSSSAKTTLGYAKVPNCFAQMTQPEGVDYLIVPSVSSERRRYVPIGFLKGDVISSNAVQIIPNATLYHFGVLTSNVHMAWMRAVCGRLKSDYRYSKEIVYNTFPWPVGSEDALVLAHPQNGNTGSEDTPVLAKCKGNDKSVVAPTVRRIEQTAQQILDARAQYPGESLADLYDETLMPPELRKAHQANDRAVMAAYGFPVKDFTESDCVARLMQMYKALAQ